MKKFFKWLFISVGLLVALAGIRWAVASDEQCSMINDVKAYLFYMYEGLKEATDSTYTMDYTRVHHYIDKAIEFSPTRANAYYSKALYYSLEDGDDSRAVAVYKKMYDDGVDSPYCAYMAGEAYDRLGVKDSAVYFYKEAYRSYEAYLDTVVVDTSSFEYSRAVEMKKCLEEKIMLDSVDTITVK